MSKQSTPLCRRFGSLHRFLFVLVAACFASLAMALLPERSFGQEQGEGESGYDITVLTGSFLPNQIDGVTEILPLFGGRFAWKTGRGAFEFGVINSHAYGVDFTSFELSMRGEFGVGQGLSAFFYGGGDVNWYIPIEETSRKTDTGVHFGGGAMLFISEGLWARSEMKFMGGPGTSLSLLFGIVFR